MQRKVTEESGVITSNMVAIGHPWRQVIKLTYYKSLILQENVCQGKWVFGFKFNETNDSNEILDREDLLENSNQDKENDGE